VHIATDTMSSVFPGDLISLAFDVTLDSKRDITHPIARAHLVDAFVEALLGHFQQTLRFRRDLAYTGREG
jgi:hypothetical protein